MNDFDLLCIKRYQSELLKYNNKYKNIMDSKWLSCRLTTLSLTREVDKLGAVIKQLLNLEANNTKPCLGDY